MRLLDGFRFNMITLVIIAIGLLHQGQALMCYICGQNNLQEQSPECETQFQYDCLNYAQRFNNAKILCRTSRHRAKNNTFTVLKECIAEEEHLKMFPEGQGKKDGCDVIGGEGFELAYCVCDGHLCNAMAIHDQMIEFEQTGDVNTAIPSGVLSEPTSQAFPLPAATQQTVLQQQQQHQQQLQQRQQLNNVNNFQQPAPAQPRPSIPELTLNAPGLRIDQQPQQPGSAITGPSAFPAPIIPTTVNGPLPVSPPVGAQPFSPQQPRLNSPSTVGTLPNGKRPLPPFAPSIDARPTVAFIDRAIQPTVTLPGFLEERQGTKFHMNQRPTAGSVHGLVCMVCGEGNLPDHADCSNQVAVDCSSQYPPDSPVRCFTRHIAVSPGKNAVEKLCVTDEVLLQQFGEEAVMDGCASLDAGRMEYCACTTNKCNEQTIGQQMDAVDGSLVPNVDDDAVDQSRTTGGATNSMRCYVCGESDLNTPTDCERSSVHDCGADYGNMTDVYCLTRQTRLANGKFSVEKRCISKDEHMHHYPDSEIVMSGCGSAYENYVQYCVCQGDLCNMNNLTEQQQIFPAAVTKTPSITQKATQSPATTPTTQVSGAFAQTGFSRGPMVLPPNHSPFPMPQDNRITETPPGESGPPTDQLRPPTRHHITQSVEVSREVEHEKAIRPILPDGQLSQGITNSSPDPQPTTLDRPFGRDELHEQQRQVIQQRQQAEIEQNAVAAAASATGPFNHRSQWNRTATVKDDNSSPAHHLSLIALLITLMLPLM